MKYKQILLESNIRLQILEFYGFQCIVWYNQVMDSLNISLQLCSMHLSITYEKEIIYKKAWINWYLWYGIDTKR